MSPKSTRYHPIVANVTPVAKPRYCWGADIIACASGYQFPDWYLTTADCLIEVEIELSRSNRAIGDLSPSL